MKRCILLALSFILLLGTVACAVIPEETAPKQTVAPPATEPAVSGPSIIVPEEREEMVTVSMLTGAKTTTYHKNEYLMDVSDTVEHVFEYDADHALIGIISYDENGPLYSSTYDRDPSRPLLEQYIDSEGNKHPITECTYNENGDLLTCFVYDLPGEDVKYYYYYDDSGRLQKMIVKRYIYDMSDEAPSERITETFYTYDSEGRILSEDSYEADAKTGTKSYTYDESGKLLEVLESDDYGWHIRTYDAYGNIMAITNGYTDASQEPTTMIYQNIYDSGKLVECMRYEDEVLITHTTYDSNGNEIRSLYYTEPEIDGDPFYDEYRYDKNGRLILHISSELGVDSQRYDYTYIYTYDENGWLTNVKTYSFDELTEEYTAVYTTLTVTKEQAKNIEKANQHHHFLPEPNC